MHPRGALLLCLISCGTSQGTLEITTGGETDVLTKDPKPTQLVVETFDTTGMAMRIGQAALPATTIDLVEQKKSSNATIRVTARDDQNTILATGSSLLLNLGVLADHTLQIFIQRNGELARMPREMGDAREDPVLATLAGRYIFMVGGSVGLQTQIYDLMSLTALTNPPAMKILPRSIVPLSTAEVLIGDSAALAFDFAKTGDDALSTPAVPAGLAWSEVAGGPTIQGDDGTQYVVGPARTTGMPTDKILIVKSDGTSSFATLGKARLGAATCWVSGRGLIISGSTMGMAGIEQIPPGTSASNPNTNFPDSPSGVCAPLDGSRIVIATGPKAQLVDLVCTTSCMPAPFGGAMIPNAPLQVFSSTAKDVFALADDADGTTHAYRIGMDSTVEVAFKIPRKRARGLRLPTGSIAVVGGSTTIESFVP